MHKGLLDREHLKTVDGVKYFRDTLRHHLIKGAQCVFLWRDSINLTEQEEETWRWSSGSASCHWS